MPLLHPQLRTKLVHVDGDGQRLGYGMAVRLAREDSPLGWKNDAGELLEIGDVVCGPCTAADLDVVVVPRPVPWTITSAEIFC
jgi:hypothetical protein